MNAPRSGSTLDPTDTRPLSPQSVRSNCRPRASQRATCGLMQAYRQLETSLCPDHDPTPYRTNCSELAEKYMNGWNRLFVVIAVCWAIVSPFLVAREANRAPELTFYNCADSAHREYGSSDSPLFNMNRYIAETNACSQAYVRDGVRIPRVLRAMVGTDDRILGLAGCG